MKGTRWLVLVGVLTELLLMRSGAMASDGGATDREMVLEDDPRIRDIERCVFSSWH